MGRGMSTTSQINNRLLLYEPEFKQWLDDRFPGTIMYHMQNPPGDTSGVALASNRDVAGVTDSDQFPGGELLSQAGGGVMDKDNWIDANATLTNPSPGIIRLARAAAAAQHFNQTVNTIGKRYRIQAEARSDGNVAPRITQDTAAVIVQGTTSTDWQTFDVEAVSIGTSFLFRQITGTGTEYTEWRNISITEANPLNADITGATVGQPFGGNIPLAFGMDGLNDNIVVDGASLAAGYSLAHGEPMVFGQVNPGVWTDGNIRELFRITAGTDLVSIRKNNNNQMLATARLGGVTKTSGITALTTESPFVASMQLSDGDNDDSVQLFFNDRTSSLILGGFGTADTITDFAIGSSTVPSRFFSGLETTMLLFPDWLTGVERAEIILRSGIPL